MTPNRSITMCLKFLFFLLVLTPSKAFATNESSHAADADSILFKEMTFFQQGQTTDTLAFESRMRQYLRDIEYKRLTKVQCDNLCAWFCYLKATNQYPEMIGNVRRVLTHVRAVQPNDTARGEWLSRLRFELGQYYYSIQDISSLEKLLRDSNSLFKTVNSPLIRYYYHTLQSIHLLNKQVVSNDTLHPSTTKHVLASFKKSIHCLNQIPQETLDSHQISPIWSYYNIALIYEKYTRPMQLDSVQHYLHKAEEYARENVHHTSCTHYCEYMINIHTLQAYTALDTGHFQDALEKAFLAKSFLRDCSKATLTYKSASVACYRCLEDIYRQKGQYNTALQYADSVLAWQLEVNAARRANFQAAVEKNAAFRTDEILQDKLASHYSMLRRGGLLLIFWLLITIITVYITYYIYRLKHRPVKSPSIKHTPEEAPKSTEDYNVQSTLEFQTLKNQSEKLRQSIINNQVIPDNRKERYITSLDKLDFKSLDSLLSKSSRRLTSTDKYYILCFVLEVRVEDITNLLNIEPSTVYAVRYRIKKKFPKESQASLEKFR